MNHFSYPLTIVQVNIFEEPQNIFSQPEPQTQPAPPPPPPPVFLITECPSGVKLIAFEYENKESRESKNHTKRLNWSSFKEALYRNLGMSQQPYICLNVPGGRIWDCDVIQFKSPK